MENKGLKKKINEIATSSHFQKLSGGWFKESDECIGVLSLQKSNFGSYYEINIKIFIQGIFGHHYEKNKNMVKRDTGDVFRRLPNEYKDLLNLEIEISESEREKGIKLLFSEFINPFINQSLTRVGLIELEKSGDIFLLPAVKKELYG